MPGSWIVNRPLFAVWVIDVPLVTPLRSNTSGAPSVPVWDGVERPIGTIQIIHGMSEHIARYGKAAEFLNSRGFIVAGDDHRAHGETDRDALGLAGEGDLFEKTVSDERGISQLLKERTPAGLKHRVQIHPAYGSRKTASLHGQPAEL